MMTEAVRSQVQSQLVGSSVQLRYQVIFGRALPGQRLRGDRRIKLRFERFQSCRCHAWALGQADDIEVKVQDSL